MSYAIECINAVVYFAYQTMNQIFEAFDLSWGSVVCFFAVLSVILRLFAANLVGSRMSEFKSNRSAFNEHKRNHKESMYAKRNSRTGGV